MASHTIAQNINKDNKQLQEILNQGKLLSSKNYSTMRYLQGGGIQEIMVQSQKDCNAITDAMIADYIIEYNKKYPKNKIQFHKVKNDLEVV